jgi:raffinose/stachyose/melibiose transport system permease protein
MAIANGNRVNSDAVFNIIGSVIFVCALVLAVFPMLWMFLGSFRTNDELFRNPLALPGKVGIEFFITAWKRSSFGQALFNSIVNSLGAVTLTICVASPAAFALSRIKFPGSSLIVRILTSSILASGQLIMLPLFFTMRRLGLSNTLWATIIGDSALYVAMSTVLFFNFYREIPFELEEATLVDGCGRLTFYARFIVPLSTSIFASVVILTFLWSWNEYMFALTFLMSDKVKTIPVALRVFFGQYGMEYNQFFACLSLSVIPLIILYLFLQRAFIKGMTAGAIKM